jgi:hypothetical protein
LIAASTMELYPAKLTVLHAAYGFELPGRLHICFVHLLGCQPLEQWHSPG